MYESRNDLLDLFNVVSFLVSFFTIKEDLDQTKERLKQSFVLVRVDTHQETHGFFFSMGGPFLNLKPTQEKGMFILYISVSTRDFL